MALSESYDFSLTRDGLINEAYNAIGAIALGVEPTTAEYTSAGRKLNLMLKAWQAEGIALWLNQKVTLFLVKSAESYLLGPTGGNVTPTSDAVKTEIATAGVVTDTNLIVDSIVGITNGDYIGVELDDGTVQWTTVNGVPSGSTVVLATGLTSAAAVDNHVYTYTTKIQRPLGILEARRVDSSGNDTPLMIISRQEYMSLSNKSVASLPNQIYYDPQLTNGALYMWPTASDVQVTVEMTIKKPIMDMDESADDGEFPVEWSDTIVNNLAIRIGIGLGLSPSKELKELAAQGKFMAKTFDVEKTSTFFQPQGR
jgi:hypothetical protein